MKWWLQSGRQRQLLTKSLQGSSEFCLHLLWLPSFLLLCSSPSPPYPPTKFLLNISRAIPAHYIRVKTPTQQNWSNLKAILTCWIMGKKKCPKQQQNVFFSVRWVLRDTTSLFLAFPSTLKIQSLRGCILPHSSRMFSLKDKAWIIYHHCNKLWNCLQL